MATGHGRLHFQQELHALEEQTLDALDLVVATLDRTLEALQHQDIELAALVIADDDRIDGRYLEVHQELITLLATQSPVATDLRLISALLHVIKSIERGIAMFAEGTDAPFWLRNHKGVVYRDFTRVSAGPTVAQRPRPSATAGLRCSPPCRDGRRPRTRGKDR